jgi:hypothetical protein
MERFIGSTDGIAQACGRPITPIEIFRLFNPATNDLVFWGDSFNVVEVAHEAARILTIPEGFHYPSDPPRVNEKWLRRIPGGGQWHFQVPDDWEFPG